MYCLLAEQLLSTYNYTIMQVSRIAPPHHRAGQFLAEYFPNTSIRTCRSVPFARQTPPQEGAEDACDADACDADAGDTVAANSPPRVR